MTWLDSLPSVDADSVDHRVRLHGVSWEQFETLLDIRGDGGGVRMTYWQGELELMSPSAYHEGIKKGVARLVEAYAEESGIPLNGFGAWTLKLRFRRAGLEPDECYAIGEGYPKRPDIAIEVVWTSGGMQKLDIYRELGVPEVWTWKKGRLHLRALENGDYVRVPRSRLLPDLDLERMLTFLDPEHQTQSTHAWRRHLQGG